MPAAIYARKSTESEDRQVQSLEDQLAVMRRIASSDELNVDEEILEAKSAKEPGTRPAFARLVELIKTGKIDGLLVWHINRLSRNQEDGGVVAHLLHSGKLKWIRTPDRLYTPDDSALLLAIETGMATSFIQDLRKSVKRGLDSKARKGWRPTRAPLGYVNNRLTREVEIDEKRFYIMQHGWQMIANGHSVADVRRELHRMGLRGQDAGKPLPTSRLYVLFRNKFYCGSFEFGQEELQGKHTPMVDRKTFDLVQRKLGSRNTPRDPEQKHPFTGIFECPVCGCSVTAETKVKHYKQSGQTRTYSYYRCTGARGCRACSVRGELLDHTLTAFASAIAIDDKILAWAHDCIKTSLEKSGVVDAASNAEWERIIALTERRLARLRTLRLDDEISAEEYSRDRRDLENYLLTARSALANAGSLLERVNASIGERLDVLEKASGWNTMANAAKRSFLRSICKRAYLTPEKVEIEMDSVMAKLVTIGPAITRSESLQDAYPSLAINTWCSFWEEILTLEKSHHQLRAVGQVKIELPILIQDTCSQ